MLKIESFGIGGANALVQDAVRVLIKDHNDNPICIAVSWDEGGQAHSLVAHVGDDDFNELLQTFGINKTKVMRRIEVKK